MKLRNKKIISAILLPVALMLAGLIYAAPEVHYDECKQPFSYQNASYLGTTDKNNNGNQWCYLKVSKEGSSWGLVREETIPRRKTVNGNDCLVKSRYQSSSFHGCSTENHNTYWCYIDGNDTWENCESPDNPENVASHTLPVESDSVSRIVAGSCFKDMGSAEQTLSRLVKSEPDLFLWLGDNIYGDTTDMSIMRSKYDAKKSSAAYQAVLEANIPVMATWDDHDFGANNEGRHYSKRAESQAEFLRHFDIPQDDPRHSSQQGIYSAIMQGASDRMVHTIMLDARYHRSPTFSNYGSCEGDQSTILGEDQWAWLEAELNKPSDIKVIGSGIQVLPPLHRNRSLGSYCAYGNGVKFNEAIANLKESEASGTKYESWAEMPLQRQRLLRLVQRSVNTGKTQQVIFVSGDQHWGELLQKTIPDSEEWGGAVTVYEVTASGFGQNWPYDVPNPNRLPIWADTQDDGNFQHQCVLPFKYADVSYDQCISRDKPALWCYTKVDSNGVGISDEWGYCAPEGATIPGGKAGKVPENLSSVSTGDRYLINKSSSNYGQIDIDWLNQQIKLSIQTDTEEVSSTVIDM